MADYNAWYSAGTKQGTSPVLLGYSLHKKGHQETVAVTCDTEGGAGNCNEHAKRGLVLGSTKAC